MKNLRVTFVCINKRHYEVIISFGSPYSGLDELEVHKFDGFKRARKFIDGNNLRVMFTQGF